MARFGVQSCRASGHGALGYLVSPCCVTATESTASAVFGENGGEGGGGEDAVGPIGAAARCWGRGCGLERSQGPRRNGAPAAAFAQHESVIASQDPVRPYKGF